MESFAPKVRMPGGYDYTPMGWEWIMAFAFAGCEWAIKEADKPEFRQVVKDSLRQRERDNLQNVLNERLAEVDRLRDKIRALDS